MSCNAWNHAQNCSCGWGGDGHLGRRTMFTDLVRSNITFRTYRDLQKGFTTPNARCPVCARPVFFYASPFGGRVFFDELGPPWTKHPCTDSGRPVTILTSKTAVLSEHVIEFEKDGWVPFLCQDIRQVKNDPSISKLTGIVNNQKQTLYVIKDGLSDDSPFLIKFGPENEIWLSTILSTKYEIKADNFRAFEYESNLRTLMRESTAFAGVKNKRTLKQGYVKNFGQKKELQQTLDKTHLYKCPECSAHVANLAKHIKKAHENKNLTLCPHCGQQVNNIDIHYERVHSQSAIERAQKRKEVLLKRRTERNIQKQENIAIRSLSKKGRCPFCEFKSTSEFALTGHLFAAHSNDLKRKISKR